MLWKYCVGRRKGKEEERILFYSITLLLFIFFIFAKN